MGPWTAGTPYNETDNGGSVTLTYDQCNSGLKCLQCSWATGDYSVGLTKNFSGGREVYVRWYGRWESGWDFPSSHKYWILWDAAATNLRMGFYTFNAGGTVGPYLGFYSSQYGDVTFCVYDHASEEYPLAVGGPPHPNCANWENWHPVVDTWYCFEAYVKVHATEGQVRFWINDVEKEIWQVDPLWGSWWYNNYTPVQLIGNTGDADIGKLDISTQNNDQVSTKKIWFDDLIIADSYIGLIDAPSPPIVPPGDPIPIELTGGWTDEILKQDYYAGEWTYEEAMFYLGMVGLYLAMPGFYLGTTKIFDKPGAWSDEAEQGTWSDET